MRHSVLLSISVVGVAVVATGCGNGEHADSNRGGPEGGVVGAGGGAGSGGNGVGDAGRGQTPVDGGVGGSNPFATCGGAIVDSRTGKVNAAEYGRQARLWDLW
jgi:hypothetical protein